MDAKLTKFDEAPDLLTVPEAAQLYRVGKNTMYELVKSKNFPRIQVGTRILIPKAKFRDWINDQTKTA